MYTFLFSRVFENWDFATKCIPLPFASFLNLTKTDDKPINICPEPEKGMGVFEWYDKYLGPYLSSEHCEKECERFRFQGTVTDTTPKKTDVEIAYWIASNEVQYNEEYLIHDIKSLIGSIGGTMGLFLGFSLTGLLNYVCASVKNRLRK